MSNQSKCREFNEQIDSYIDDELSAEERSFLDSHIETCNACKMQLKEHSQIKEDLRTLPKLKSSRELDFSFLEEKQDCAPFRELVDAYHDNELDNKERIDVEKHLSSCTPCAQKLTETSSLVANLKSLPRLSPSMDIVEKLDLSNTASVSSQTTARGKASKIWYGFAAAAAVAALFLFTGTQKPQVNNVAVQPREEVRKTESQSRQEPLPEKTVVAAQQPIEPGLISQAQKPIQSNSSARQEKKELKLTETVQVARNPEPEKENLSAIALMPDTDISAADALGIGTDEDGLYDIKL